MNVLSLLKKKQKKNKFLTIELDNTQIKVIAFYKSEENKLKIIGSSVKKIPENIISNFHILDKKALINIINEAIETATFELEDLIDDVIIGIKGMQCIEFTTTAKATSTHQRVIEVEDINEVYNKVTEAAFNHAQNEAIKINADYDADLEIILTSSVYNKIDNKFVEEPLEQEGEILECALFNAFAYKNEIKTLKNLFKQCKLNVIAVAPIPYTMVQSISKTNLPEKSDYSLINLSLDSTEIIIVFGGGLIDTKKLPIGYSHIKEAFANTMGLTLLESDKVLKSYSAGKLKEEELDVVKKCLSDVLYVWLEGVKLCYEEFLDVKVHASQMYLTGEGSTIPDVIELFKNDKWYKEIPFKEVPICKKLNINDFSYIQDATGKINSNNWITTQSLNIIYLEQEESDD